MKKNILRMIGIVLIIIMANLMTFLVTHFNSRILGDVESLTSFSDVSTIEKRGERLNIYGTTEENELMTLSMPIERIKEDSQALVGAIITTIAIIVTIDNLIINPEKMILEEED